MSTGKGMLLAWMIGAALAGTSAASEEASVRQTPEGIEATVAIDGKRETFRARDWDEFRKKYPKIYERHFRGSGAGGVRSEAGSGSRPEAGGHFRRFTEEVSGCEKCREFGMCARHGEILRKIREHMKEAPPEVRERAREWLRRHEEEVKGRMVKRFDGNGDGSLDEAERKSARAAIEERHPGLLEHCRDRREDVRDQREDGRDRREDVYDRAEDRRDARHDGGKWDKVEDRFDRAEDRRDHTEDRYDRREDHWDRNHDGPLPDPFRSIRDEREDVWDRREDRRDRTEDRLDRREDIWDDAHDGGRRDRIEDKRDKAEDRRDKREDGRDRREDKRDRKK